MSARLMSSPFNLHDYVRLLLRGGTWAMGTVELTTGTTTTLTDRRISANSLIVTMAASSGASNANITNIICSKGSAVINHAAGAAGRTFAYEIRTPAN